VSNVLADEWKHPDSSKVGRMAGAPPGKGGEANLKVHLRDAELGCLEGEPTG